ncbi:leucine-rich repeat-containing protein 4B-like [Lethenteron reissneri]|uniref:leucine-rich repeat-containing protein 4B-like n=1 Tax=Lethenteron reissneri TaxID=7753 RepID=UPI002AB65053|nr:leucine-rich repeat-containing protein 4B-like [Lethenteron reissneri]
MRAACHCEVMTGQQQQQPGQQQQQHSCPGTAPGTLLLLLLLMMMTLMMVGMAPPVAAVGSTGSLSCPVACTCRCPLPPLLPAECSVNCTLGELQRLPPLLPDNTSSLDLSHNNIQELEEDVLSRVAHSLSVLNLTDNKIFRLGVHAFRDMTSLLVLDLSDNQIGTLPNGVFDNLTSLAVLDVSGNPLDCGCELAWLPWWLVAPARAGRVVLARPLRSLCALPDRLAHTPVTAANFSSAVCAADYVACLRPASTLIFSAVDEDAHDELGCNAACARRRLAYFSSDPALNFLCLCGDAGGSPPAAPDCAAVCSTGYPASRAVCGRVVVAPPAPVRSGASFRGLRPSASSRRPSFAPRPGTTPAPAGAPAGTSATGRRRWTWPAAPPRGTSSRCPAPTP